MGSLQSNKPTWDWKLVSPLVFTNTWMHSRCDSLRFLFEASCSIQLPQPASRISPRPRSVDFRWSWETPEATFTTKPGLPSQLRPLHSGGPASRLRVFRRITKKHSEEMQQEKLSNHWSTAGFLKNQKFGCNIWHPTTLQLPPPTPAIFFGYNSHPRHHHGLTLPCPPAKSLEKVSLPAWGKQVNAAVIW